MRRSSQNNTTHKLDGAPGWASYNSKYTPSQDKKSQRVSTLIGSLIGRPLEEYQPLPCYQSLRYVSSSEGPFRSSHRAPCQSPTRSTPRTASSLPRYRERSEERTSVYDANVVYGQIGMALVVDRAPIEAGPLPIAASHESKRSKKQLKNYKSQLKNQPRTQVEEFDITPADKFSDSLLEDIFTIGKSSKYGSTRGMFHSAGNRASDA
ncbi:hypothetical protein RHS04_01181 [Rhizoctonia solani]|uniref:Uncharacterized protein n=1 Tax=Rhizoctonia solani TaxID=456999 RepID=A0A8H7LN83_9AGAM|nr:hypothetical protein RHS04_01181 [Rhizoctonia solani]